MDEPAEIGARDALQHDVFICHTSEDKVTIARPLANALREHGIDVWYDEFSIEWGDSLRQKIDHGVARCRYGIVVLSPAFFAKPWTQYELDGLADREMTSGDKVILPIWHNVDHDAVAEHSPSLALRSAKSSRDRHRRDCRGACVDFGPITWNWRGRRSAGSMGHTRARQRLDIRR